MEKRLPWRSWRQKSLRQINSNKHSRWEHLLNDVEVPGAVWAYMMRLVGSLVDKCQSQTVMALFEALYKLHKHGWYQGDARWQNAIWSSGQILWIDFMDACFKDPLLRYYKLADLKTLASSLIKQQVSNSRLQSRQEGKKYERIAVSVLDEMLEEFISCLYVLISI